MPSDLDEAAADALRDMIPEIIASAEQHTATPGPPSSAPGEYPHKRTGQLSGGFVADVTIGANGAELTLSNTAPHADVVNESRPYMDLIADEWGPRIAERVERALAEPGMKVEDDDDAPGFVSRVASFFGF